VTDTSTRCERAIVMSDLLRGMLTIYTMRQRASVDSACLGKIVPVLIVVDCCLDCNRRVGTSLITWSNEPAQEMC
jgi:hypothetical protein